MYLLSTCEGVSEHQRSPRDPVEHQPPAVLLQLERGAGAVLTFGVRGGHTAGVRCVEACELFSHVANIGDTKSLILHPASTTHRQLTPEQREAAGAGDDVLRLSVGLETVEDLLADLDQALAAAHAQP